MKANDADHARTGDAPKRMTLSAIVEKMLERGGGEHSSITLARNAKGDTQIEVVVRTGETGDVQTIAEAEATAVEVYERLRAKYPPQSATQGDGATR